MKSAPPVAAPPPQRGPPPIARPPPLLRSRGPPPIAQPPPSVRPRGPPPIARPPPAKQRAGVALTPAVTLRTGGVGVEGAPTGIATLPTQLTVRGYEVPLRALSADALRALQEELTARPIVNPKFAALLGRDGPPSFPLWRCVGDALVLPRAFGEARLGPAIVDTRPTALPLREDLRFIGALRPNQLPILAALSAAQYCGIVSVPCGRGKCVGYNTPVLMFSGEVKPVQDVVVGDVLMGDDSTPRTVMSLARGREAMYRVTPTKGMAYDVNESHILSLKCSTYRASPSLGHMAKGAIVDISVRDFLALPASYHGRAGSLLSYRVGVAFPAQPVLLDPYMLGYWLGDGDSRCSAITTMDAEVVTYFRDTLTPLGLSIAQKTGAPLTWSITNPATHKRGSNAFLNALKTYGLLMNKHVPPAYLHNSREVRLQLLAGLLDADGHRSKVTGCYDIVLKVERLLDDAVYLARSLGFAAYKVQCQKTCTNGAHGPVTGTYYRTNIHGAGTEAIPCKIPRKQAVASTQRRADALVTRIQLRPLGEGDYYGFTLAGTNRRFLLGDFTVTHNTACTIAAATMTQAQLDAAFAAAPAELPRPLALRARAVVVVHKEFLAAQWEGELRAFVPGIRVGRVQGSRCDVGDDVDVTIAMIQTLVSREYPAGTFARFGLAAFDECHHLGAEVFSRALASLALRHTIGLSATPDRADGLRHVFERYLGRMVYQVVGRGGSGGADGVTVRVMRYGAPAGSAAAVTPVDRFGDVNPVALITTLVTDAGRTDVLAAWCAALLRGQPGRQVLVLSERRAHLVALLRTLRSHGVAEADVGFYVGGMPQVALDVSATKPVVLATYQMAAEGMNIPTLNAVLLATPKGEVEQAVGRILRQRPEERVWPPVILDVLDVAHPCLSGRLRRRRTFYKREGYSVAFVAPGDAGYNDDDNDDDDNDDDDDGDNDQDKEDAASNSGDNSDSDHADLAVEEAVDEVQGGADDASCVMCADDTEPTTAARLSCSHVVHALCATGGSIVCPLCRMRVTVGLPPRGARFVDDTDGVDWSALPPIVVPAAAGARARARNSRSINDMKDDDVTSASRRGGVPLGRPAFVDE